VQAHVQPLSGLTLTALTSSTRPSSHLDAEEATSGSLGVAYDALRCGRLAAMRQQDATASRHSEITSFAWRQQGLGQMAVRYVHQRASDSTRPATSETSSRVEVDLPLVAPRCAGCLDLRAGVTADASSQAGDGLNSRLTGRISLVDDAALTGDMELGLAGGDRQVLRGLRVTTEMAVLPAARLQLSYVYRMDPQLSLGQVFEARLLRRVSLGW
jgi:hypothetical protein